MSTGEKVVYIEYKCYSYYYYGFGEVSFFRYLSFCNNIDDFVYFLFRNYSAMLILVIDLDLLLLSSLCPKIGDFLSKIILLSFLSIIGLLSFLSIIRLLFFLSIIRLLSFLSISKL